MFDLQTHTLPESEHELRRVAIRMGFQETSDSSALAQFNDELARRTALNRKILDHLLHDAFGEEGASQPETELGAGSTP